MSQWGRFILEHVGIDPQHGHFFGWNIIQDASALWPRDRVRDHWRAIVVMSAAPGRASPS